MCSSVRPCVRASVRASGRPRKVCLLARFYLFIYLGEFWGEFFYLSLKRLRRRKEGQLGWWRPAVPPPWWRASCSPPVPTAAPSRLSIAPGRRGGGPLLRRFASGQGGGGGEKRSVGRDAHKEPEKKQTDRRKDRSINGGTGRPTDRSIDGETDRHRSIVGERQTDIDQ